MRRLICGILLASLIGCEPPTEVSRSSVGKILSATPLQGSFSADSKTAIQTEKMSLVIVKMPPVPIGVEGFIVTSNRNEKYFTWTGAEHLYQMY